MCTPVLVSEGKGGAGRGEGLGLGSCRSRNHSESHEHKSFQNKTHRLVDSCHLVGAGYVSADMGGRHKRCGVNRAVRQLVLFRDYQP